MQPRNFTGLRGHHKLATDLVGDRVSLAEFDHAPNSLHCQSRLLRPGLVVEAAVQHSTVVSGLMASGAAFLFENDNLDARVSAYDLMCGCQADNPRTDYNDFHGVPCGCETPASRCIRYPPKDSRIPPASHHTFTLQLNLCERRNERSPRRLQMMIRRTRTSGTPNNLNRFSPSNIPSRISARPLPYHHLRK